LEKAKSTEEAIEQKLQGLKLKVEEKEKKFNNYHSNIKELFDKLKQQRLKVAGKSRLHILKAEIF